MLEHGYIEQIPKTFLKESSLHASKALIKISTS